MLRLHHFHSSSTSFRVRIALNLKGLEYESVPVRLAWEASEHDEEAYRSFNPQANVPVLVDGDAKLVQSIAIIEYLDAKWPDPPLFPREPAARARALGIALHVACEIQAPNNLRVERYLAKHAAADPDWLREWRRHWITVGFDAIERQIAETAGAFAWGDSPTVVDCLLVPQVYNARRPTAGVDIGRWPTIARVFDRCLSHPAFERALPTSQPGYESPTHH